MESLMILIGIGFSRMPEGNDLAVGGICRSCWSLNKGVSCVLGFA